MPGHGAERVLPGQFQGFEEARISQRGEGALDLVCNGTMGEPADQADMGHGAARSPENTHDQQAAPPAAPIFTECVSDPDSPNGLALAKPLHGADEARTTKVDHGDCRGQLEFGRQDAEEVGIGSFLRRFRAGAIEQGDESLDRLDLGEGVQELKKLFF